jgi:DNA primase
VNDQKKFYHCFGCGAHGDVIKFESEQTGMSFKDAAYKIADKFQIPVPKFSKEEEKEQLLQDRVMTLLNDASNYFVSCMNNNTVQTLIDRGIKKETINRYHIGYSGKHGGLIEYFAGRNVRLEELANCGLVTKRGDGKYYEFFNNRIIIPILSSFGKVIAFGGRANGDDMPKYLNSAENPVFKKGESLFGEDIAYSFAHKSGFVILVEGYFDVIGLHQSGFQNVVASLGTAVTEAQLAKL